MTRAVDFFQCIGYNVTHNGVKGVNSVKTLRQEAKQ